MTLLSSRHNSDVASFLQLSQGKISHCLLEGIDEVFLERCADPVCIPMPARRQPAQGRVYWRVFQHFKPQSYFFQCCFFQCPRTDGRVFSPPSFLCVKTFVWTLVLLTGLYLHLPICTWDNKPAPQRSRVSWCILSLEHMSGRGPQSLHWSPALSWLLEELRHRTCWSFNFCIDKMTLFLGWSDDQSKGTDLGKVAVDSTINLWYHS